MRLGRQDQSSNLQVADEIGGSRNTVVLWWRRGAPGSLTGASFQIRSPPEAESPAARLIPVIETDPSPGSAANAVSLDASFVF
jgi:hypothetical protein